MNVQQHAALLRRNAHALAARLPSEEDEQLKRVPSLLRALADQVEQDTLDPFLRKVTSARAVELLLTRNAMPDPDSNYEDFMSLVRSGLDALSFPLAQAALLALWPEPVGAPSVAWVSMPATL